ncbi:FecR domain-containing protein [uncultured Sunxiuqinia sp.]|uniref:FecR family protein n=1 Tax=uncultured Sunxiuqinia sp. TaxID=1573825 RepID=UPI002AA87C99|nr:FecR domain-containing protein [uncultured Sunxiuqinia sp.]
MTKRKQFIEWDIINKKLKGELSETEEGLFNEWLNTTSKNRRYFEHAKKYYEKGIEELDMDLVADTNLQFMGKLNYRTRVRRLHKNLQIAAAIILPLLLVGGIWATYKIYDWEETNITNLTPPAKISNKAQLITTSGDILALTENDPDLVDTVAGIRILNDIQNGLKYPEAPKVGDTKEAFNTLITPLGGEYKITLSDGTRVFLNCGSELKYPIAFNGEQRIVTLKGEAFFDVVKDSKPFIVETADVDIRVLGTRFNVMAYADEPNVQTTLTRGRVNVETVFQNGASRQLLLKPGEQAEFIREQSTFVRQSVDTTLYVDWINGYFRFENEPFDDVMHHLARWYNIDYQYQGEVNTQKILSGKISRKDDFDVIMTLLSRISETDYTRDGNQVKILTRKPKK